MKFVVRYLYIIILIKIYFIILYGLEIYRDYVKFNVFYVILEKLIFKKKFFVFLYFLNVV